MDFSNKYQYTIGVVARRTQMHPETLRVWERRYKLIVPGRSDTGRRLYSESDISKLLLVKQLTDLGHSISSVADLSDDELKARLSAEATGVSSEIHRQHDKCRVIFLDESLRMRIGRDLLLFDDIDIVNQPQNSPFAQQPDADVFVVELATINERSLPQIQKKILEIGCAAAIVVFNFGTRNAIAQLERSGIICLKGSVSAAEIRRACLSVQKLASRAASHVADTVAPRRFDAEQLARVATMNGTIACECPNHLAELIINLAAFEQYSSECANRNDKDAQLHAQLNQSAGKARMILEESLQRLIEIEGIAL